MSFTTSILHQSELKQINNHLEAVLCFPKIVYIQNKYVLNIVNLSSNNKDKNDEEQVLTLDDTIIDKSNIDNYLWLILKSNKIVVIDILRGTLLKLKVDNYKICSFRIEGKNLFLVSEGGECLLNPFKEHDLNYKLKEELTEEIVFLEKANLPKNSSKTNRFLGSWEGLSIYSENDGLLMKCPLTDLYENVSTNEEMKYILPWDDATVIAHQSSMWIVDFKSAKILFEFPKYTSNWNYCPVAIYKNTFYFITWDTSKVIIHCAVNASISNNELVIGNKNGINTIDGISSSQETLKSQLNAMIDSIISEQRTAQVALGSLQNYFDKIDDQSFLINIALRLCHYNFEFKSILYPFQNKVYSGGNNELIILLSDLIIKVDLLEYISFRGNDSYKSTNLFEKTFKELCVIFVSNSDFDLASICWLKYKELEVSINSESVNEILNSIPYNVKISTLIIYLKNVLPSLLEGNPFFIDIFVKWTMERVFKLEQSMYWPKIGLKFIEEMISVLELSLKMVTVRPVSMDDLDILKDRIFYVMELKDKYKINMLLSEFSSQSPSEIGVIMLRRCYTEDLEIFLQDYLPSYASRHIIDLDDALRTYIESEAAISGGVIDGLRLKILLYSFRSTTTKLDCLLQVLKVLHVPWDVKIYDLAVEAAASAHKDFTVTDMDRTLASEIQNEFNYAKVKVILKKYNFPLSCTDYLLVLNKLMMTSTVDLNDLKVVTSVMTNLSKYGHILFIDKCLHECETRIALDYFQNLSNKEKNILLKAVKNKYEQVIIGDKNNKTLEKNYIDFLKGTELLSEIQIKDIENLYYLKNSYNIILNLNTLYIEDHCFKNTTAWMLDDGRVSSSSRGFISHLTRTQESCNTVLLNLLLRTSVSHSVRKFIEELIWKPTNITVPLSSFKNGNNSSLLLESLRTIIELLSKCEENYLHFLMHYVSILNSVVNADLMLKNVSVAWKFQYIYMPMSSIVGLNDLINFIEARLSSNPEIDVHNIVEGYDFIPLRMIAQLLEKAFTSNQPLSETFYMVRDKIGRKLLSKAVLAQEVDEILITSVLLILSRFDGNNDTEWLIDSLKGQSDNISPSITNYLSTPVIRRTFILDSNCGNVAPYPPQYVLKYKFNINLTDIALPDSTEETWDVKVLLLYVLKQYPNTSFNRLIDICRNLNITINDGLTLQLICLLASWELKYKVASDDLHCRQIYYDNNEKELISQCFTLWDNIANKEFILDVLKDFWKNGEVSLHGRSISINPYYYEVYMCIYHLLFGPNSEPGDVKEYFLLNFLKNYRRASTPKQYEFELFSVKGMFPEVGYYRLPFYMFMREDMWSNLKSEITLETYERWLPVVALLSLDADIQTAKDMICSNALKQTMTSRKNDGSSQEGRDSEPWRLITKEEPLLRAAHRCVRHIANMEWAGACLFYVLQGCARGADQVAAAQLCYQFAQRWAAVQPGNRAVRQMERLHSTLSTRHILHKVEWVCEEFVRLSTEPAQLIRALYLHPSFVEKVSRHDINRAANEIADKNGINVSSIRIQILENILEKTYEENKNKKISTLTTKELMTAKYILKATCPKMGAIYLSRIAFDDDSDYNKYKKLRALQCLISVIEGDTAVKVTNREREALWTSLLELLSIVNLENVDMPWVVATFKENKILAIEQMLQAGINVEGLKIAAELARRYGNVKIIRNLIPNLLRTGLFEEMTPLLLKASSPPNEVICTAWRAVIVSPFQRADYPITDRQKRNCLNSINLLPVCPVIRDEDLVEIWKNCIRFKCIGIGCLVLPYLTSQGRQSLNELYRIDKRNLIASLKNLHTETYLVSGAMFVIENLPKGQR